MPLNNSQFGRSMGTGTISSMPSGAKPMPRTSGSKSIGQGTGTISSLPRKTMGSSMGGMGR